MIAILFLVGRILYGASLTLAGVIHFTNVDGMSAYAKSQGVPAPRLAVIASGVALILGALSIVLGVYVKIGVLLLVIFFIPVTLMMHPFWKLEGEARDHQQVAFMKNMIILGAALMFLLLPETWPLA
jgi:putative oxidoreductase